MAGLFSIFAVILISSFFLTMLIKKYAEKKLIIDLPNERSSHVVPTPRGGGVAFAISFLIFSLLFKYLNLVSFSFRPLEILALITIIVLGFYDDKKSLSPVLRLIVQSIAVIIFLLALIPTPPLVLSIITINPGTLLNVFIFLYLVWLINLYNFMDGINGIASLETISVCLGMCLVYWITGNNTLIYAPLLLSISILGFLPWNFPNAKIFMGDVGSNFLGLTIGMFSLQAFIIDPHLLLCWVVLLGVFIVDTSTTLIRRILKGEKIHLAHCNHAYQHAARKTESHALVSLSVFLINIIWLLPISILISMRYLDGFWGLVISYIPLCGLSALLCAKK